MNSRKYGNKCMCLLVLRYQCCFMTSSVDEKSETFIDKERRGRESSSPVCGELDTVMTVADDKCVQRPDGHFDLLGMQIFLYKGAWKIY